MIANRNPETSALLQAAGLTVIEYRVTTSPTTGRAVRPA